MATTKQKDACDFLDADHKAVKKMFAEYIRCTEPLKRVLSVIQKKT